MQFPLLPRSFLDVNLLAPVITSSFLHSFSSWDPNQLLFFSSSLLFSVSICLYISLIYMSLFLLFYPSCHLLSAPKSCSHFHMFPVRCHPLPLFRVSSALRALRASSLAALRRKITRNTLEANSSLRIHQMKNFKLNSQVFTIQMNQMCKSKRHSCWLLG